MIEMRYNMQTWGAQHGEQSLTAHVAQPVEHTLGKGGVMGSIPIVGSIIL